jgi:thiamine pyrophosphate-dependent acetolactate synthase large subunit-like protein
LTAAEYELPITFVVINDQAYGAVANIQEREYGSTVYSEFNAAGKRAEPYTFDAAAVATGCGIPARVVEDPAAVGDALAWAHHGEGPTVVDIRCDRTSVVPSGGGVYLHDYWNHRALPPVTGGAYGA